MTPNSRSYIIQFNQPDTLIPDPYNPLDWNRYGYARYNAIKYTDPSGHRVCNQEYDEDYGCERGGSYDGIYSQKSATLERDITERYHIRFSGSWNSTNKILAIIAVVLIGEAFADVSVANDTAWGAFNAAYGIASGDPLTFQMGNCGACMGGGGYTYSSHRIAFASLSTYTNRALNNIVHELGHAFDWSVHRNLSQTYMPRTVIMRYWGAFQRATPYSKSDAGYYGLGGPRNQRIWHQNPSGAAGEEFADTFLGWVFGKWETGAGGAPSRAAHDRMQFMSDWMPLWVNVAAISY